MSGFPGQHGYAEFAANQRRLDRDEAKNDIRPVERSMELPDITDSLGLRLTLLRATKADMMTERELQKTVAALEGAIDHIKRMQVEIEQLRQQARKAGTSEAK